MTSPTSIQLSRRSLLGLFGAVGAGIAVTGCAGPGSTAGNQPTELATGAAEGEISFAHWRAEDKAVFDKLIAEFTAKFPDVKVTQDISPPTTTSPKP